MGPSFRWDDSGGVEGSETSLVFTAAWPTEISVWEGRMANTVKVLVVGLGNMGASHASAYHRNPGFEIVGLMSRSMKSKKIPDELNGYPLFEDYDEALKATKPDAVSINSW